MGALLGEHQVSEKRDERVAELERKVEMLEQKLEKLVVKEGERETNANALEAASSKIYFKTYEHLSELKQKLEKIEDDKDSAMKDGDLLKDQLAKLTKDQMELGLNLLVVVETCLQSEVNVMKVEQRNLELQKEVQQLKEELLSDTCEVASIESDIDSSYAEYDNLPQLAQFAPPSPVGYHLMGPHHPLMFPPPQLVCSPPTFPRQVPSYLPRPRGIQHFNPPVYYSSYDEWRVSSSAHTFQ